MDVSRVTVNSEMFDKTSVRVDELTDVTITDRVGVENRKARGSPVLVIHVQFTARLLLNLLSMHACSAPFFSAQTCQQTMRVGRFSSAKFLIK